MSRRNPRSFQVAAAAAVIASGRARVKSCEWCILTAASTVVLAVVRKYTARIFAPFGDGRS